VGEGQAKSQSYLSATGSLCSSRAFTILQRVAVCVKTKSKLESSARDHKLRTKRDLSICEITDSGIRDVAEI
jgi:hypothetical protein